ncbi:unnamed protein product [Linum tenue]|uniref:Uncharacterized protein n=1 Tax=Linum tenue TaxID=586396 RepID=A0AAV0PD07_9ROSI|nr:unnamed protein product [Linum tenue]
MAAASFHARSNSLPARSHPLISEIDEQICRLRQSQAASTSSSSSIGHNLNSLQVVYDCVDQLFQLSSTQQALINDQKCFNELLDGSLRLLDLCNTAKDALSQMKESVAELQSAIRRRQGGMEGETRRYLKSRKTVIKAIQKVLKGMENKKSTSSNNVETLSMLKEAESAVVKVLECLLAFISQTSSKPSSWSLFKRVASASSENEFADVDASLKTNKSKASSENEFAEVDASLKINKSSEEIQLHLKNLQPCIQDLEEGVENLFRRLIKTRVSILNIHNL